MRKRLIISALLAAFCWLFISCEEEVNIDAPLAMVKIEGKSGYINAKGKQVIKCIYDEASDFRWLRLISTQTQMQTILWDLLQER